MARDGAVVHGVFAVERDQPTVRRQHQRIDLHQLGIAGRIGRVKPAEQGNQRGAIARQRLRQRALEALEIEAVADIDRQPQQGIGMLLGDLLDVHAALRREQQQRALGCRIVQHGRVHLVRDRHLLLDQHLGNAMLADAHAEDGGGGCPGLVRCGRQLDAAGLAALAGRHLRLDHARPQLARRGSRLIGAGSQPAPRRVDAGRAQQRLGSVLLEIQNGQLLTLELLPLSPRGRGRDGHDLRARLSEARPLSAPRDAAASHVGRSW